MRWSRRSGPSLLNAGLALIRRAEQVIFFNLQRRHASSPQAAHFFCAVFSSAKRVVP
jgi:hypothetical protein